MLIFIIQKVAKFTNSVSTGNTGTLKNTSNRQLQTNNDKNAISGNLIFKHKFKKAGEHYL